MLLLAPGERQCAGSQTALVVPGNTKTAVTRTCRYDPNLNPRYQDFGGALRHGRNARTSLQTPRQGQGRGWQERINVRFRTLSSAIGHHDCDGSSTAARLWNLLPPSCAPETVRIWELSPPDSSRKSLPLMVSASGYRTATTIPSRSCGPRRFEPGHICRGQHTAGRGLRRHQCLGVESTGQHIDPTAHKRRSQSGNLSNRTDPQ